MLECGIRLKSYCRRGRRVGVLGISFITLNRWIYSDKIRAIKTPTGRWMISESEVERIVGGRAESREDSDSGIFCR